MARRFIFFLMFLLLIASQSWAGEWVLSWDGGYVKAEEWNLLTPDQKDAYGLELKKKFDQVQGTEGCLEVHMYAEAEGDRLHFWVECKEWDKSGGV